MESRRSSQSQLPSGEICGGSTDNAQTDFEVCGRRASGVPDLAEVRTRSLESTNSTTLPLEGSGETLHEFNQRHALQRQQTVGTNLDNDEHHMHELTLEVGSSFHFSCKAGANTQKKMRLQHAATA